MNLNDAFSIVIDYMISQVKNKELVDKLNIILNGLKDKKHVEEELHPRFQSLVLFGTNLFPFSDNDYVKIAEFIKRKKL